MNVKKIGIWTGAFVGSFIVLLALAYFLFPYLNPEKAQMVQQKNKTVQKTAFDPGEYSLQAVDSLNTEILKLHSLIDSLQTTESMKQQMIDSLNQQLGAATKMEPTEQTPPVAESMYVEPIEEASKPLLSLDEDVLAPIVDLLEEHQLISLYREGSSRQREKLLRTLKPEKAAKILKKVM